MSDFNDQPELQNDIDQVQYLAATGQFNEVSKVMDRLRDARLDTDVLKKLEVDLAYRRAEYAGLQRDLEENLKKGDLDTIRILLKDYEGRYSSSTEAKTWLKDFEHRLEVLPAPPPPLDLKIHYLFENGQHNVQVSARAPEVGTVRFYPLRKEPSWPPGSALTSQEFAELEAPLHLVDPSPEASRIMGTNPNPQYGATYYLAIAEAGYNRIVGEYALGLDGGPIGRLRQAEEGSGARLFWDWPDGCSQVKILWRSDAPPDGIDDPLAEQQEVTHQEYLQNIQAGWQLPIEASETVQVLLLGGVSYHVEGEERIFYVPRMGRSSRIVVSGAGRPTLLYRIETTQGYSISSSPRSATLVIKFPDSGPSVPELLLLAHPQRQPFPVEAAIKDLHALEIEAQPAGTAEIRREIPHKFVGTGWSYRVVLRDPEQNALWRIKREH